MATREYTRPDGCISIDANQNDIRALPCARDLVADANGKNRVDVHNDVHEAIRNLLGQADKRPGERPSAHLIGHGTEGRINVGCGKRRDDRPQMYLGIANIEDWTPWLAALQDRFSELVLWACDTGAGRDGVRLLSALSSVLHTTVAAPTNVLNCNRAGGFAIIDGEWQEVVPGQRTPDIVPAAYVPISQEQGAEPTNVPGVSGATRDEPNYTLAFWRNDDLLLEDLGTVSRIECRDASGEIVETIKEDDRRLARLKSLVFVDGSIETPSPLLGVQTGTLVVNYKRDGSELQATWELYNNRLLRDVASTEYRYYHTRKNLLSRLIDAHS